MVERRSPKPYVGGSNPSSPEPPPEALQKKKVTKKADARIEEFYRKLWSTTSSSTRCVAVGVGTRR